MDKIRKYHNDLKRSFILKNVVPNSTVLDVGCGRGGDLQKWRAVGARLTMCDPDGDSLIEAKKRASSVFPTCRFFKGDILSVPPDQYDYVCFNFSLQYIFKSQEYAEMCIRAISNLLKPGGKFIGVVPDAQKIPNTPTSPKYGEMILVNFQDGPYYSKGAISEPLCYKSLLVHACLEANMFLTDWNSFAPEKNGEITDIYSHFIFHRI